MVDDLFCARLTGHRGGHAVLAQAGAETSDAGSEAVNPDLGSSWEGHSRGVGASVRDKNSESCGIDRPLRIPLVISCMSQNSTIKSLWNSIQTETLYNTTST